MRPRFRRRLFWGIYGHGLLMIGLAAGTVAGLGWALRGSSPWQRTPERLAALLEKELGAPAPEFLEGRLRDLGDLLNLDLAIYGSDGRRVAQAGGVVPEPLDAQDRARLAALAPSEPLFLSGRRHHAISIGAKGAYLVSHWRGQPGRRFYAVVAAVLAVLALASLPRARRMARPVERTIETAARWARGDLSARVALRHGPPELVAMGAALDEMVVHLAALRRRERALLADISHELRTPLARLRVALEWAEEEGELPVPLRDVGVDLAELERLVDDVLGAARLEQAGAVPLRRAPVDVAALCAEAVGRFARVHTTPVTLAVVAAEVSGDGALLGRALRNLLENAARHGAGPVALTSEATEGGVWIRVRDHGPGVPPESLALLFDPFFRVDESRARATGGVGLGLAFVRKVVEAHGGRVEADRPAGGGLCVGLWLPRAAGA